MSQTDNVAIITNCDIEMLVFIEIATLAVIMRQWGWSRLRVGQGDGRQAGNKGVLVLSSAGLFVAILDLASWVATGQIVPL